MPSKTGPDKRGQRFLKILYEACFWSAWLCAGWMVGESDPGTDGVSGTQWCEILCPQIEDTRREQSDILITLNFLTDGLG